MGVFRSTALAIGLGFMSMTGAFAEPITGTLNISSGAGGAARAEDDTGANVPFADATFIDFLPDGDGPSQFTVGPFTSPEQEGNLASLVAAGDLGQIKDFSLAIGTSVDDFYTVNSLSFDLTEVRKVTKESDPEDGDSITVRGRGILDSSIDGFDPTVATFVFTFQTGTSGQLGFFSFSATSVATGEEPGPVPEPASLALFGAGLLGLAVLHRRRRRA